MILDVVETLSQLVSIPSVNPMGRSVSGPQYYEYALTDHLQGMFERLGWPWERHEVAPLRTNILTRIDGASSPEQGGPLILFEAHQDTVPVEGMTIAPWTPQRRQGRVYGRGACDIKGGMACMLAALSRLAADRPANIPTIVLACTVNEEHGFSGASHLTRTWQSGISPLLPRAPDAVIVAEPTLLNVVVAHKGVVRWVCHTHGRAAHSSQPHLGENAIYSMSHVLRALEQYAQQVVPGLGEHPLVGRPSLSVGTIAGGISVNTVPDRCSIEIDRRLLPGDDPQQALQHTIDYIAQQVSPQVSVVHDEPFIQTGGLSNQLNGPLASRLSSVAKACGGAGDTIGVPYGTDAAAFSAAGIATVVFGPGSIDQAHTVDEWIAVEQLEKAVEILYQFGRRGLDDAY